jgi:hypothetical protein
MRLCREAAIEGYGKVSCCYKKNISQDTTCRKTFVIGCPEKVQGWRMFVKVFEKGYRECSEDKRRCGCAVTVSQV